MPRHRTDEEKAAIVKAAWENLEKCNGTPTNLAHLSGTNYQLMKALLDQNPELQDALSLKLTHVNAEVEKALLDTALGRSEAKTNVLAINTWLNNRASDQWSQRQTVAVESHGFKPPPEAEKRPPKTFFAENVVPLTIVKEDEE